jgi:hypothetical protein
VRPRRRPAIRRALARAGDADDEDHLAVAGRARADGARGRAPDERARERFTVVLAELERGGTCGRTRGLRPPRTGDRDDVRRQLEQPRERDLRRRRSEPRSDVGQYSVPCKRRRAARAAERRMGDNGDAGLGAPLDDASPDGTVVDDAQRDLHRRDRSKRERLVEPAAVDVRDADARHEPLVGEPCQRADRRRPGRPRIRRVDEVEVDRDAVERREACLAVAADRLRPPVRHPPVADARHPALGDDAHAAPGAGAPQRGREQRFVVGVRAGSVEHGDAGRGSRGDRPGVREPHAAEADPQLRAVKPCRTQAQSLCRVV